MREQQQVVDGTPPTTTPATLEPPATTGGKLTGDLAVVALAASLENLAVQTYGAGIAAATAGKLGAVPPAVVTFAQTVQVAPHASTRPRGTRCSPARTSRR